MTRTPFDVADPVQGSQHFFRETGGLGERRLDDIRREVGKACQVGIAIDIEHIVEKKEEVLNGRFVRRHGFVP